MFNDRIPKHVAIIPDGNRRWAEKKGIKSTKAYAKSGSYENLKILFNRARKLGVKYLSIWGFSTENWRRSENERKAIFNRILEGIEKFIKDAPEEGVRFTHVGSKDRLPIELLKKLDFLEEKTKNNEDFFVYLCIDYGGRDELVRAAKQMMRENLRDIDEETFLKYLDAPEMPDLDLIIRTGGELRTSGLLIWHAAYSEIYTCDKFFPEFTPDDLEEAIVDYSKRKRRYGK